MNTSPDKNQLGLLVRALAFAADKHKNQRRKGVEQHPYINHPIALANLLVNEGGVTDTDVICAALLHDTIEDTETTLEELTRAFGSTIAGMVAEVTDDKCHDKGVRKQQQVAHAPTLTRGAKLVKLADKIANLTDIMEAPPPDWSDARKREYFDWARKVVDGLRGASAALEALFDAAYARGAGERMP